MRMVVEVLSPGMEHGDGADLGAQMPGIGSNQAQGVGGRLEQQPIDELLAVKGDLTKPGRQGEDQMKIGHRQQLGLALDQPLDGRCPLTLRAVPVAAGIVSDADLAAALTLLDVAAQSGGAAGFDGGHDAPLVAAEVIGMGVAVSSTVAAEDVRHLKGRAHAGRFSPMRSVRDAAGRAG